MGFFDKVAKHEALFCGMNERLGVDFGDLLKADAETNVRMYRNAVLACTTCRKAGECAEWQQEHATATETPNYCRNKRFLDALAAK